MAFRKFDFAPVGRPVIKIAEIKGGISKQTQFTNSEYDDAFFIREGDMLFCWSGQPESSIDVFKWHGPDGWLNQHIFKVEPDNKECAGEFLFQLLKYLRPNFIAIARNKQTTGLGHVTRRDMEEMEISIPPRSEQRAIAHVLGTLDDKIELNRRMSETLEAIARALFKSWFVDFDPVRAKAEGRDTGLPPNIAELFPDRFEPSELGEIPAGWEVRALEQAVELNPPRALKKGESAPYLEMANMPEKGHVPDAFFDRPFGSGTRFINGDTLLARITPCLENGKTAYVDFLEDGQVGWGSTEYIVMRPKPPLPNAFAYCLARSPAFRDFAIGSMTGSSGRQRVQVQSIAGYELVIPTGPVALQFEIRVRTLLQRATAAVASSRMLAAVRDALLPKLVSGELRVKDSERFAEAAS